MTRGSEVGRQDEKGSELFTRNGLDRLNMMRVFSD